MRGGRQKGSQAKADDLAAVLRLDWNGVDGLWLGGSVYLGRGRTGFCRCLAVSSAPIRLFFLSCQSENYLMVFNHQ